MLAWRMLPCTGRVRRQALHSTELCWNLLQAGADDVMNWCDGGAAAAVAARLHRWAEVEEILPRLQVGRERRKHPEMLPAQANAEGRHDADQSAVWQEVDASLRAAACVSPTAALSDAYAKREQELAAFRRELSLPEDAVGVAAFHGNKLPGIDLFDRHETLRYFWESLVDSYAIDWLSAPVDPAAREQSEDQQEVKRALESAAGGQWEAFDPPGEGQDWRLNHEQWSASALVWEEKVVISPAAVSQAGGRLPH
jgi:hypothetical protein